MNYADRRQPKGSTPFFEALYRLKDDGKIRGKQTFTREFDINRWNLNKLERTWQVTFSTRLVDLYSERIQGFRTLASDRRGGFL